MAIYKQKWSPDDWEDYARKLVSEHHGLENIVDVPDQHKGDYGIEAYSLCGSAYQMYAPEGIIDINTLYERQKGKIYSDIKKFIDNEKDLIKLFGGIKIKRWILLTPENKSSELIKYANKKTEEVISKKLPYVDEDFRILIKEENNFHKEREALINAGLHLINIDFEDVTQNQIDELESNNAEGITNLNNKIDGKYGSISPEKRTLVKRDLIKNYILGSNVTEHLHKEYPEIWEKVVLQKRSREKSLLLESIDNDQTINGEKNKLKVSLLDLNKLHENTAEKLSLEAVSDWIMRCPLDFK
ncbi:MAG: hypothetical protein QNL62_06830 [Gammaproteobacteria bacterium]|nr:hypothetical protein [Gammaproteobacteria bacterium]